ARAETRRQRRSLASGRLLRNAATASRPRYQVGRAPQALRPGSGTLWWISRSQLHPLTNPFLVFGERKSPCFERDPRKASDSSLRCGMVRGMAPFRVIMLPGSVLPGELAYRSSVAALGSGTEALVKELEVYVTPEAP